MAAGLRLDVGIMGKLAGLYAANAIRGSETGPRGLVEAQEFTPVLNMARIIGLVDHWGGVRSAGKIQFPEKLFTVSEIIASYTPTATAKIMAIHSYESSFFAERFMMDNFLFALKDFGFSEERATLDLRECWLNTKYVFQSIDDFGYSCFSSTLLLVRLSTAAALY